MYWPCRNRTGVYKCVLTSLGTVPDLYQVPSMPGTDCNTSVTLTGVTPCINLRAKLYHWLAKLYHSKTLYQKLYHSKMLYHWNVWNSCWEGFWRKSRQRAWRRGWFLRSTVTVCACMGHDVVVGASGIGMRFWEKGVPKSCKALQTMEAVGKIIPLVG